MCGFLALGFLMIIAITIIIIIIVRTIGLIIKKLE